MTRRSLLVLSLAVLASVPATAMAGPREQSFGAHLTGADEKPDARVTPAQGQVTIHLDRDGTATYHLIASNIDNVVAAHIHCPADEDGTAGAIVHLATTHPGGSDGVNSTGTFDPSTPCQGGTMTVLEAMRAGLAYVNVHTNDGDATPNGGPGDFPGGEIRGQLDPNG